MSDDKLISFGHTENLKKNVKANINFFKTILRGDRTFTFEIDSNAHFSIALILYGHIPSE